MSFSSDLYLQKTLGHQHRQCLSKHRNWQDTCVLWTSAGRHECDLHCYSMFLCHEGVDSGPNVWCDTTTSNFVLRENDPPEIPPDAHPPLAADCTPFTYVLEWYKYDVTLTKLVVAVI